MLADQLAAALVPAALLPPGKSISHSAQMAKASSRQAQKDSASMIVGWTISLPGKTAQVTAMGEAEGGVASAATAAAAAAVGVGGGGAD